MSRPSSDRKAHLDLGYLGETLVAQWIQHQGGQVWQHRWTCRLGELDLVVQWPTGMLAFVEVKTRSSGNWDQDGLLAISARKRAKLWHTAEFFLVSYPQLAQAPCRFDVALVRCGRRSGRVVSHPVQGMVLDPAPGLLTEKIAGHELTLQAYLEGAFDGAG
jgi:putative endonuclease